MTGIATGMPIEVAMDVEASAEEVRAVKAAFSDAGVEAIVDADVHRKSADLTPWVIYISVPLGIFLKSFLEAAGKDAYARVKRLSVALHEARRPAKRRGSVVIMDTVTHQWVLLDEDLPDLAFQRLFEMDIVSTDSGTLQWDPVTERWRDVWDMHRLDR